MELFKRKGRPPKNVVVTPNNTIIAGDVASPPQALEPPRFNVEYESEPKPQPKQETPTEPAKMLSKEQIEQLKALWNGVEPYLSVWNAQEVANMPDIMVRTVELSLLSGMLLELRQLRGVLESIESAGDKE